MDNIQELNQRIQEVTKELAKAYAIEHGIPVKDITPLLLLVQPREGTKWTAVDRDGVITNFDEKPQKLNDCWDVPESEYDCEIEVLNWEDLVVRLSK